MSKLCRKRLHRVRSKSTVLCFSISLAAFSFVSRAQTVAPETVTNAQVATPEVATPEVATPEVATTKDVTPEIAASPVVTRRATALVFLGADGISYFRSGLRAANTEEEKQKLPAILWLKQTAPDALSRVFPGGGGVLVRRDRRARAGEIVQKLLWAKPAPGGGVVEEELPFDAAAFAQSQNLQGFALRSISNLQLPQSEQGEATRVFLRVTFSKAAKPAETPKPNAPTETPKTPAEVAPVAVAPVLTENPPKIAEIPAPDETREFLGWYDLNAKIFTSIFQEPQLVGAEVSPDGKFVHVLAARGEETQAILLDGDSKELRAPALAALRAVGFLYRGWIDGAHFSLKKAGQNQVVIYDATNDSVAAPKNFNVFAAAIAPRGNFALAWPNELAVSQDAPSFVQANSGAPQALEIDGPILVADWRADGSSAILLGAPDERRRWTRAWLLSAAPFETREIVLPAPVASAKFLYEAL